MAGLKTSLKSGFNNKSVSSQLRGALDDSYPSASLHSAEVDVRHLPERIFVDPGSLQKAPRTSAVLDLCYLAFLCTLCL